MTLFGRRTAPVAEPTPTLDGPRCTACGAADMAFTVIPLPEYGPVTVCATPAACRQRAQLLGIYLRRTA